MRVAAVDCGTNSIRLLVTDLGDDRQGDLVRETRIVRLGHDVDRTGRLGEQALARTLAACDDYAATIRDLAVDRVGFCATSATRDASNAADFEAGVLERFGVRPRVLSGDDEARLAFDGASRELDDSADPVLLVDLGGGSTELVLGRGSDVVLAQSLDIGSVRMTERHLHTDPPTADELSGCAEDVDRALDRCDVDLAAARSVVGVAGTVTTLAADVLGLASYDSAALHLARIARTDMLASCQRIASATVAERRALAFMHPGRADVIGGGAVILARVLERVGTDEVVVSERDILDGIAWSLA